MEIIIRLPVAEKEIFVDFLDKKTLDFELVEQKGLDATQVIELIFTYGPDSIAIINGLIDMLEKIGKMRKSRITIDASK